MKAVYKLNINIGNYAKGAELFPHNEGSLFGHKVMKPGTWGFTKDLVKALIKSNLMIELNPKVKKPKKEGEIPKKLKELARFIKSYGIDSMVFYDDAFIYQYRINGTDCNATCYAGQRLIDDDYNVTSEIAELLRKKIISGYQGGVTVEGRDIMNILSRFGVTCYLNKLSPKNYLEADYQFNIEEGSDS